VPQKSAKKIWKSNLFPGQKTVGEKLKVAGKPPLTYNEKSIQQPGSRILQKYWVEMDLWALLQKKKRNSQTTNEKG